MKEKDHRKNSGDGKYISTRLQERIPQKYLEQATEYLSGTSQYPTSDPTVFFISGFYSSISASEDVLVPSESIPMHSHTFMEIVYYTSGDNIGFLIGSQRYVLQKGDMVLIPPGVWHCTLRSSRITEICRRYLLLVKAEYFRALGIQGMDDMVEELEKPYIFRAMGSEQSPISRMLEHCIQEYQQREAHWQEMLECYTRMLLIQCFRVVRSENPPAIKPQKKGIFEKCLAYVDENLVEKITLADTARALFTSERTITREFQKNAGLSFYRYVKMRKLDLAVRLIGEGRKLEGVSEAVGCSDYPTFSRAFKKQYGVSPRQMRQTEDIPGP